MRRPPDQVSALGFTGLLTGFIVWALQSIMPNPALRPMTILLGGVFGAALASELLFSWITWRLKRERSALLELLTAYEALHDEFERKIVARQRLLLERDASRKVKSSLQSELDQLQQQYTRLFGRMRDRLSRITDQISD